MNNWLSPVLKRMTIRTKYFYVVKIVVTAISVFMVKLEYSWVFFPVASLARPDSAFNFSAVRRNALTWLNSMANVVRVCSAFWKMLSIRMIFHFLLRRRCMFFTMKRVRFSSFYIASHRAIANSVTVFTCLPNPSSRNIKFFFTRLARYIRSSFSTFSPTFKRTISECSVFVRQLMAVYLEYFPARRTFKSINQVSNEHA